MPQFTYLFGAGVILMVACDLWLSWRHVRHVQAHRNTVPAAFEEAISLDEHRKAADYTVSKTRFGMFAGGVDALFLLAWTLGGGLNAIDSLVRRAEWGPITTGVVVILSVMLVTSLLSLPFSLYRTFGIEARFGFNKVTLRLFLADLIKGLVVSGILVGPLLLAVLALMERLGASWWLWVWALWTAFTLSMMWIFPAFIAPLFNKFRPLVNPAMLQRVDALLTRHGFAAKGVFIMDGSRRSSHGNAYFTGLGRTKRVVFFDTLLNSLDIDEVEAVLAHELGHFKLHHVKVQLVTSVVFSFAGLALLGWLLPQEWFYTELGMRTPSTYAALMLFAFVGPVFTYFLTPLRAWNSRRHEFAADNFALAHVPAKHLVNALVKLYRDNANTLTPDTLHSLFHDSHPPAPVRIAHLQQATGATSRARF